jgi:hypothetical protein
MEYRVHLYIVLHITTLKGGLQCYGPLLSNLLRHTPAMMVLTTRNMPSIVIRGAGWVIRAGPHTDGRVHEQDFFIGRVYHV